MSIITLLRCEPNNRSLPEIIRAHVCAEAMLVGLHVCSDLASDIDVPQAKSASRHAAAQVLAANPWRIPYVSHVLDIAPYNVYSTSPSASLMTRALARSLYSSSS